MARRGALAPLLDLLLYPYHLLAALLVAFKYVFEKVVLRVPVSYPGNPIANPQRRTGDWPSKRTTMGAGWLFASDYASHEVSMKRTRVRLP